MTDRLPSFRDVIIGEFKRLEQVIIPRGTASPDDYLIITNAPNDRIVFELETTKLPLGTAAGLETMTQMLRRYFNEDEVSLQKLDTAESDALDLPSHYKLTLTLPINRSTCDALPAARRALERYETSWLDRIEYSEEADLALA